MEPLQLTGVRISDDIDEVSETAEMIGHESANNPKTSED
jgi:hypothetical protein